MCSEALQGFPTGKERRHCDAEIEALRYLGTEVSPGAGKWVWKLRDSI